MITVHTEQFTYQVELDSNWFWARHVDGRVYELDTDDLIQYAHDWLNGDWTPDDVNDAYEAMCAGFYSDWEDGLFEPKASPTR